MVGVSVVVLEEVKFSALYAFRIIILRIRSRHY